MSASPGTTLDTVIIFTQRMEELARWYAEALGLGDWDSSPGHLGQQVGPVYLGFDAAGGPDGAPSSSVTLWFTVDDLEATYERVVEMGAEVRYPPSKKPWGGYLASVADPDGNILGLSQRMD